MQDLSPAIFRAEPKGVLNLQSSKSINLETTGEVLIRMLADRPWAEVDTWLQHQHPDLLERIKRLRFFNDEGGAARYIPEEGHLQVWRALPEGCEIRPGDWIALDHSYANTHAQANASSAITVVSISNVSPSDVHWAGTDCNEFFYLPAAWRVPAGSLQEYLLVLGPERLRMLCDGEHSMLNRHSEAIVRLQEFVLSEFDGSAVGTYHGPEHWRRVALNAATVARSMGIDPLVPAVFGWVHDSQRIDEGLDPEHGPRAAQFVEENRATLFGFMSDDQIRDLTEASMIHSDGTTDGSPTVRACLDGDRLDLWRVGVRPDPKLLCTEFAKKGETIGAALHQLELDRAGRSVEDIQYLWPEPGLN